MHFSCTSFNNIGMEKSLKNNFSRKKREVLYFNFIAWSTDELWCQVESEVKQMTKRQAIPRKSLYQLILRYFFPNIYIHHFLPHSFVIPYHLLLALPRLLFSLLFDNLRCLSQICCNHTCLCVNPTSRVSWNKNNQKSCKLASRFSSWSVMISISSKKTVRRMKAASSKAYKWRSWMNEDTGYLSLPLLHY